MDRPKLVTAKIELRFDTKGGFKDCIPEVNAWLKNQGFKPGDYMITGYDVDKDDQDVRVVDILVGGE